MQLLISTIILRPYVFIFLASYLFIAIVSFVIVLGVDLQQGIARAVRATIRLEVVRRDRQRLEAGVAALQVEHDGLGGIVAESELGAGGLADPDGHAHPDCPGQNIRTHPTAPCAPAGEPSASPEWLCYGTTR